MENTCHEKEHIPTWAILYPGQTNISYYLTKIAKLFAWQAKSGLH